MAETFLGLSDHPTTQHWEGTGGFDWSVLKSIEQSRKLERETSRKAMLAKVTSRLRQFAQDHSGLRFYVFGSLIRADDYGPSSDVDLAVEGLPGKEYWKTLAALESLLETEDVNLVELERCSFAEGIRSCGIALL